MHDRRAFLGAVGTAFAGLALGSCDSILGGPTALQAAGERTSPLAENPALGPLLPDPAGILDLPQGFTYRILSQLGDIMSDGFTVPDAADGMGMVDLGGNEIALIRNHELLARQDSGGVIGPAYDVHRSNNLPLPGGTTTLVLDARTLKVKRQFRSLAGTIGNCSGGVTPWGSWLSCEETTTKANKKIKRDHGFVFEVPARAKGLVEPRPLTALGRFNHEAACVDPKTGIVYMTEDRNDSLFYRFVPKVPGHLDIGGTLQALVIDGLTDTDNWDTPDPFLIGDDRAVRWITLDNVEAPEDDLRYRGAKMGATRFTRGEGLFMGNDELYFTATAGGKAREGQIFRLNLRGRTDRLDLFFESSGAGQYSSGDNLCVAPFGHLIVCEDQYADVVNNHLRGITADGASYSLAHLKMQTELAGACFSPDGKTLFVNAYSPAKTFAIQGPWPIA